MSYHPTLGRFIQRDPLGYVDGGSLYEYVKSSPLQNVDPIGLTGAAVMDPLWNEGTRAGGAVWGHSDFPGGDVFDYNLEDTGETAPGRDPERHFRDMPRSETEVAAAIRACQPDAFQRAMHRGQDWFSHWANGFRYNPPGQLGHFGQDWPDNPHDPRNTAWNAYQLAWAWTQRQYDAWNASCTRDCNGNWVTRADATTQPRPTTQPDATSQPGSPME